jgi:carbamoyltransferase
MGLASYGQPCYADLIRKQLIDLKPDGSFRLHMEFFNYCTGMTMTSRKFERLFGGRARREDEPLEQRHLDLAASIQAVTEEVILRMATAVQRQTGEKNLALAGGVALNCVANGRLLREGPFEHIWVQPAAGDAGGALGAALFVWHQLLDRPRHVDPLDAQQGSLLGPSFSAALVTDFLDSSGIPYTRIDDDETLLGQVAEALAEGKIVGWFQGRMEFGPRALGARSILADARSPDMQARLNRSIKFRESFRPFAPAVLAGHASSWFDLEAGHASPYMQFVAPLRQSRRLPLSDEQRHVMLTGPDLHKRLGIARSTVPAVTHVDYGARVQTVDRARNPRFAALLEAFHDKTGCPMLVNTSFNVRGEPIVCTPAEAHRCFLATGMDLLVLENCVVSKAQAAPAGQDQADYVRSIPLD